METGLHKNHMALRRGETAPVNRLSNVLRAHSVDPEDDARPFWSVIPDPGGREYPSPEQRQRLRALATPIDFSRGGEPIFTEGEAATFIYFIDEGLIRISRLTENGRRQILAFRWRGNLAGLPDNGRYVNSAETVSATRVLRIPWIQLQEFMLTEPKLQNLLLDKLAGQIRDAQRRILMLGQQSIHQRLASFILDFLKVPAFYDATQARLKLPVNRFDLADYLGTTPESTARAFARLENARLVKRSGTRMIEILDLAGLHALQNGRRRAQR